MVEDFERTYIAGVLEAQGGELTAAAKHADMDPKNFSEKLTRYGLRRASASDIGETHAAWMIRHEAVNRGMRSVSIPSVLGTEAGKQIN